MGDEGVGEGRRDATARWRPHTDRLGRAKVCYDETEARAAADRLRDEDLDNGTAFTRWPTPYPCGECDAWHVGNWSDRAFAAKNLAAVTP